MQVNSDKIDDIKKLRIKFRRIKIMLKLRNNNKKDEESAVRKKENKRKLTYCNIIRFVRDKDGIR